MECEKCHKADATVHLTQVVNGEVCKIHLCEPCAAENGVTTSIPSSISEILLGAGAKAEAPVVREAGVCAHCGMDRKHFKQHGRLGCDACYATFEEDLTPLIRAMHHNDRHTGKIPRNLERHLAVERELGELQRGLRDAIREERFEDAATLRDQITRLNEAGVEGGEG